MANIDQDSETRFGSEQFAELAREILSKGGSLRFRARGLSMRPTIRDGDMLVIEPVDEMSESRLGDILLYQFERQLLVHRVVRKKRYEDQPNLLIQGDAVLQPDGWVNPHQVLGRVSQVERQGRTIHLNRIDQRTWGLLLALLLPIQKRGYIFLKRVLQAIRSTNK